MQHISTSASFHSLRVNSAKLFFCGVTLQRSSLIESTMKKEIDNFDFHGIYAMSFNTIN